MSAALQLPMLCAAGTLPPIWSDDPLFLDPAALESWPAALESVPPESALPDPFPPEEESTEASPSVEPKRNLAFYRMHTERMLRRYLYASMQIGRSPSILSEPIGRGWASSQRVKTFEDAVIFVMDIEHCLRVA